MQAILNTTDLGRVHELREADIPAPWKDAWIFLDHTPCGNVSDACGWDSNGDPS
jgi:hypothetical protein